MTKLAFTWIGMAVGLLTGEVFSYLNFLNQTPLKFPLAMYFFLFMLAGAALGRLIDMCRQYQARKLLE